MFRSIMIVVLTVLWMDTARSQHPLPQNATVQKDENGLVTAIRLESNSDKNRQIVSRAAIDAIAACSHLKSLSLFGTTIDDDDVSRLSSLMQLQMIDLSFTDVTGNAIAHLAKIPTLLSIRLDGCDVDDSDLKLLGNMPEIAMLHLARTNVTDNGLQHIRGLNLVLLDLQTCDISDAGLRSLGDFPRLQNLWLSKTIRYGENDRSKLTDDCVDYLLSLDTLLDLQIADSKLTDAGIGRLRDGLPKAKISVTSRGITYLSAIKTGP